MFAIQLRYFQHVSRRLIVCGGMLAVSDSAPASAVADSVLAAAKAAPAKIIGPAPSHGMPTTVEPPRKGNATPDEVAARIAVRLAQLRARQAARKPEQKREPQDNALYRATLPAATARTVGTRNVRREQAGECTFI